jgi:hypothetical protein
MGRLSRPLGAYAPELPKAETGNAGIRLLLRGDTAQGTIFTEPGGNGCAEISTCVQPVVTYRPFVSYLFPQVNVFARVHDADAWRSKDNRIRSHVRSAERRIGLCK